MPNDAQKFSPIEQAILIALYRWEFDTPQDERFGFKHALPAVPYEFIVAELLEIVGDRTEFPPPPQLWNDDVDLALKSLLEIGAIKHFGHGHDLGWVDPGIDEYRGWSDHCEGAWLLRSGRLLTCDCQVADDSAVQLKNDFQHFYKLSEQGLLTARHFYFSSTERYGEAVQDRAPGAKPKAGRPPVHDAQADASLIEQYEASGLKPTEFARARGIDPAEFKKTKDRIRQRHIRTTKPVKQK